MAAKLDRHRADSYPLSVSDKAGLLVQGQSCLKHYKLVKSKYHFLTVSKYLCWVYSYCVDSLYICFLETLFDYRDQFIAT